MRHRSRILSLSLVALAACADADIAAPTNTKVQACGARAITLAVGEVGVPTHAGDNQCRLLGDPNAEYVIAWLDTRALTAARSGIEPSYESYPIGISIEPGSTLRAPNLVGALPAAAAERATPHLHDGVIAAKARERTTPWTLGEEFLLEDGLSGLPRAAVVERIYGGHVVAVRWKDIDPGGLTQYLAQLDTAVGFVHSYLRPMLHNVFVAEDLRSSQAGQFLLLLQQEVDVPVRAVQEVSGDTLYAYLELLAFPWLSATRFAQTLAHEWAHPYQRRHMQLSRAAPGLPFGTSVTTWAAEGGANLISYEFLRRIAGLPIDDNRDWRVPATSTAMAIVQARTQPANGALTEGFDAAMGFFRHLMVQRLQRGETADEALREVSRGAIEGWYGIDGISQRLGQVARMRARLGSAWEPEEALLDWALAYAGDDLTGDPQFNDATSLRVWDLPTGQTYGWFADGILTPESPTFFLFKRHGSPAYTRVRAGAAAVTVEIQAYDVPLRWKLLRIR